MAAAAGDKAPGAFRTIGELSDELGVAQHILRYWETKFPQLRPLQRAGNRRYYRPADVDLARRIHRLLTADGYTVRGVQQLLRQREGAEPLRPVGDAMIPMPAAMPTADPAPGAPEARLDMERLTRIRDGLIAALRD